MQTQHLQSSLQMKDCSVLVDRNSLSNSWIKLKKWRDLYWIGVIKSQAFFELAGVTKMKSQSETTAILGSPSLLL